MARKLRLEFPGAIYHVINRGNYRVDIFRAGSGLTSSNRNCFNRPFMILSRGTALGQTSQGKRYSMTPYDFPYVTDAANTSAQQARQRLALPETPEVRVTLEVPKSSFTNPSLVTTKFNMPGGGMERTATGPIPVKIIKVDDRP
jgi:hypothetical protein